MLFTFLFFLFFWRESISQSLCIDDHAAAVEFVKQFEDIDFDGTTCAEALATPGITCNRPTINYSTKYWFFHSMCPKTCGVCEATTTTTRPTEFPSNSPLLLINPVPSATPSTAPTDTCRQMSLQCDLPEWDGVYDLHFEGADGLDRIWRTLTGLKMMKLELHIDNVQSTVYTVDDGVDDLITIAPAHLSQGFEDQIYKTTQYKMVQHNECHDFVFCSTARPSSIPTISPITSTKAITRTPTVAPHVFDIDDIEICDQYSVQCSSISEYNGEYVLETPIMGAPVWKDANSGIEMYHMLMASTPGQNHWVFSVTDFTSGGHLLVVSDVDLPLGTEGWIEDKLGVELQHNTDCYASIACDTSLPSSAPSVRVTTKSPSNSPSRTPSNSPSFSPSLSPSIFPSLSPSTTITTTTTTTTEIINNETEAENTESATTTSEILMTSTQLDTEISQTEELTTTESQTEEPATQIETKEPTTQFETKEPTTQSETEEPTTQSETEAPVTEAPATEAPPTEVPATELPTTVSQTEEPTTESETEGTTTQNETDAPITQGETEEPVTQSETNEPTTQSETEEPTTETEAPTAISETEVQTEAPTVVSQTEQPTGESETEVTTTQTETEEPTTESQTEVPTTESQTESSPATSESQSEETSTITTTQTEIAIDYDGSPALEKVEVDNQDSIKILGFSFSLDSWLFYIIVIGLLLAICLFCLIVYLCCCKAEYKEAKFTRFDNETMQVPVDTILPPAPRITKGGSRRHSRRLSELVTEKFSHSQNSLLAGGSTRGGRRGSDIDELVNWGPQSIMNMRTSDGEDSSSTTESENDKFIDYKKQTIGGQTNFNYKDLYEPASYQTPKDTFTGSVNKDSILTEDDPKYFEEYEPDDYDESSTIIYKGPREQFASYDDRSSYASNFHLANSMDQGNQFTPQVDKPKFLSRDHSFKFDLETVPERESGFEYDEEELVEDEPLQRRNPSSPRSHHHSPRRQPYSRRSISPHDGRHPSHTPRGSEVFNFNISRRLSRSGSMKLDDPHMFKPPPAPKPKIDDDDEIIDDFDFPAPPSIPSITKKQPSKKSSEKNKNTKAEMEIEMESLESMLYEKKYPSTQFFEHFQNKPAVEDSRNRNISLAATEYSDASDVFHTPQTQPNLLGNNEFNAEDEFNKLYNDAYGGQNKEEGDEFDLLGGGHDPNSRPEQNHDNQFSLPPPPPSAYKQNLQPSQVEQKKTKGGAFSEAEFDQLYSEAYKDKIDDGDNDYDFIVNESNIIHEEHVGGADYGSGLSPSEKRVPNYNQGGDALSPKKKRNAQSSKRQAQTHLQQHEKRDASAPRQSNNPFEIYHEEKRAPKALAPKEKKRDASYNRKQDTGFDAFELYEEDESYEPKRNVRSNKQDASKKKESSPAFGKRSIMSESASKRNLNPTSPLPSGGKRDPNSGMKRDASRRKHDVDFQEEKLMIIEQNHKKNYSEEQSFFVAE